VDTEPVLEERHVLSAAAAPAPRFPRA